MGIHREGDNKREAGNIEKRWEYRDGENAVLRDGGNKEGTQECR
jgi:hypothetical protein